MSRHTHARRRLRERLPGVTVPQVMRAIHKTQGRSLSPNRAIRTHLINIDGKAIKAVFDWRRRRIVTVMPVEANGHFKD